MKLIYTTKTWIFTALLLLMMSAMWAQSNIKVDFQNVIVTGTTACFDVYLSQGTNYTPAQSGGEWTAISLSFDLDVVSPTMGLTLGAPTFSNQNNNIIDGSNLSGPAAPGASPAGYEMRKRLGITNSTQKPLPATPTLAFSVCLPITGGPVTTDATSDIQIRTSTAPTGSLWSNGTLFSQPLQPNDLQEPLPIELITFEARTNKCDISLYWETASEKNLSHFQIEASKDGEHFAAIGQVKPKSANSTILQAYKYAVPELYQGYYFRLKPVDLDGAYDYSNIVYAKAPCKKEYGMTLYPNPNVIEDLTVEISSPERQDKVQLFVLDAVGRQLQTQQVDLQVGVNKISINTQALPSGNYFIKLIGIEQLSAPLKFIKSTF